MNFKLPLYGNDSTACDPDFKGDHTYRILWIHKSSEFLAECTGCGAQWNGKYKESWMPNEIGLALMEQYPDIQLKKCKTLGTGWVYS
jgi:hypothetical protein